MQRPQDQLEHLAGSFRLRPCAALACNDSDAARTRSERPSRRAFRARATRGNLTLARESAQNRSPSTRPLRA